MKKILLTFLATLVVTFLFAQTESTYYYYKGQKFYVPVNYRQLVVGLKQQTSLTGAKNAFAAQLQIAADSVKPTSTPNQFAVHLNKEQALTGKIVAGNLLKKDIVAYVHPCLSGQAGKLVSYGDAFVVQLKAGTSSLQLKTLVATYDCSIIKTAAGDRNTFLISAGPHNNYDALKMANLFFETSLFEYAQPDFTTYGGLADAPNDPLYSLQWAHTNTGTPEQYNGTPGADMRVDSAWLITQGSSNIKIAVIDTGVDTAQADLKKNLLQGYDCITQTSGPGDGAPKDLMNAHGTACAGIIASVANNNIGIAGIAPKCKIIPVNLSDAFDAFATEFGIASGIDYAWQNGADVLTNSWYLGVPSNTVDAAIHRAVTQGRGGKGCVIFFASGNENGGLAYPACNPEVIAVGGSSMCNQRKTPTSCDGEYWWGANYGVGLDVVAPCVKIATADISGANGYNIAEGSDGDYNLIFNGTSAACPHAAAVAALVLSVNANFSAAEVTTIIENNCTKGGDYSYALTTANINGTWNNEMGYGVVNAYKSVLAAKSKVFCNVNVAVPSSTILCKGASVKLNIIDSIPTAIYKWRVNGVNSQTGNTITVSLAGMYDVVASYTNGCTAYSGSVTITAADTAALLADAGKQVFLCANSTGTQIGGEPSAKGGNPAIAPQRAYGYDLLFDQFIRFNPNNPREYSNFSAQVPPEITDRNFVAGDFTPLGYYALTRNGTLVRIDTATGAVKLVGYLISESGQYTGHEWSALSWDPAGKKLYALTYKGLANKLYIVDLVTGKATPTVYLSPNTITWATFNSQGSLYGFAFNSNNIAFVDKYTGGIRTFSEDIGVNMLTQLDGSFDPLNGKLYMSTYSVAGQTLAEDLREIDTATGKVEAKGSIGSFNEVGALAIAGGAYKYTWAPAAGLSNTHDANPFANPSSTTTYTLTVTDACGAKATSQVVVTAGSDKPPVKITADKDSICVGESSRLSVTQNSNYTYQWTYNGNSIANPDDTFYTSGRGGKFQVSVTNGRGGCSNTSKVFTLRDCSIWLNNSKTDTSCYSYFYPPNGYTTNDTGFKPNQSFTKTIYPLKQGDLLRVTFSSFYFGSVFSYLTVYDGPDINSPILTTFSFYRNPQAGIYYSSSGGPLTFQLTSGSNADNIGRWDGFFTCYTPHVYRTKKSGDYMDTSIWEIKTGEGTYTNTTILPTYIEDTIIIQSGHTVTVNTNNSSMLDEIWIQKGATLVCAAGISLSDGGKFGMIADGDILFKDYGYIFGQGKLYLRGNIVGGSNTNSIQPPIFTDGAGPQSISTSSLRIVSLHIVNKTSVAINGRLSVDTLYMATTGRLKTDSLVINYRLNLDNGIIDVKDKGVVDLTPFHSTFAGGNKKSYVNGPVAQPAYYAGTTALDYPVGTDTTYRPVSLVIDKTTFPVGDIYKVQAIDQAPPVLALPTGIDRVSTLRYYKLESVKKYTFNNITVTLPYNTNDGVNDVANLRIVHDTASQWINAGGVGSHAGSGTITSTIKISSFGNFALANASGGNNTLPVTWLSFTATPQNKNVLLQWDVTNEVNCDHYNAEHSTDGVHFTTLAQLPAYNTGRDARTYQWLHITPAPGLHYYRIKLADKDGRITYSKTINIKLDGISIYSITPNPAHDIVTITAPALIKEIDCYSNTGQLVKKILPASTQYKLSIKNMAAGVYTLRIVTATDVHTAKVMKQ